MRVLLTVVLCASGALGQATIAQQKGKRVLEEVLAALGGDRFLGMQDRVETGRAYSFYREELRGLSIATIYTRYLTSQAPAPGEILQEERQSFGKEERDGAVLFAGGKGFELTFRGARPVPQERLDRWNIGVLHNIFYILRQRLREPGLIAEFRDTDIWMNQPIEIIDITDSENRVVTLSVHRSTRLPVRQSYVWRDPKTRERNEEVAIYSKYRDVGGGVQWPLDIERLRNGDRIFQIYSDAVEINQQLEDELFTLKPGVRVLKPAR